MSLAAKTAASWLDRAGHGAIKTVKVAGAVAHFTADEIAELKRSANEEAQMAGMIDVTPREAEG